MNYYEKRATFWSLSRMCITKRGSENVSFTLTCVGFSLRYAHVFLRNQKQNNFSPSETISRICEPIQKVHCNGNYVASTENRLTKLSVTKSRHCDRSRYVVGATLYAVQMKILHTVVQCRQHPPAGTDADF